MKPKNVIVWILFLVLVVLLMSTSVQAKELTEVNANDILEKIENGEDIFLENVRITGELDLNKIELETIPIARSELEIKYGLEEELKIVESKIEIRYSVFGDDVDFSNARFRKDIDFFRTSFLGKIHFRGANFCGYAADFRYANFTDKPCFVYANFSGYADFWYANFTGNTDFIHADFSGYADFGCANFCGSAVFTHVDFSGGANFAHVNFGGRVIFTHADFSGYADFWYANFTGNTDFIHADFSGNADFGWANFGGNAVFTHADFSGSAKFDSTEFNKKVSFIGTTFTSVTLSESDFNRMYVEWSSLKDALVFDGRTYIKLIKNFREMEQFDDADAAYYQYRRESQKNKNLSCSKLLDVVAWLTCGYGVEPEYAVRCAVAIILIFTLIYGWRGGIRRLKENDEVDEQDVSFWRVLGNAFYFSVVTFTTIGSGDLCPADRYRKAAVVIEGLLGWLILALFIVTLANVMIRP